MRNSVATRELTGELLGLGQSLLKSRSNTEMASTFQAEAAEYSVNLYGKQRTARAYDRVVSAHELVSAAQPKQYFAPTGSRFGWLSRHDQRPVHSQKFSSLL
jgi:aspartokinase